MVATNLTSLILIIIGVVYPSVIMYKDKGYREVFRIIFQLPPSPMKELFFIISPVLVYLGTISFVAQNSWRFFGISIVFGLLGVSLGLGGMEELQNSNPSHAQSYNILISAGLGIWVTSLVTVLIGLLSGSDTSKTNDIEQGGPMLLGSTIFLLIIGLGCAMEAIKTKK